jgi:hypothetical protein
MLRNSIDIYNNEFKHNFPWIYNLKSVLNAVLKMFGRIIIFPVPNS